MRTTQIARMILGTIYTRLARLREISMRSEPPGSQQSPGEKRSDTEPPHVVDLLRASERDAIVASHLNPRLRALGFVQVTPRRWVDGSAPPIRRLFEMRLLKGAAMEPAWGFSLDFVPHFSNGKVCWHRSNRSAKFDVPVEMKSRSYASFLHGADRLNYDLERQLPVALERAQDTWSLGSNPAGVLHILREIRERRIGYFYVYFDEQLPLTSMFLSAKIGDLAGAQAELEAYAAKYELAEAVSAKLAKHLREVAAAGKEPIRS